MSSPADPPRVLIHGVDIVEVERIDRMVREHGDRFLDRCFTDMEKVYCLAKVHPAPHLAARFAAKEAVLKAIGTGLSGGAQWTDIGVDHDQSGRPLVELTGVVSETAKTLGVVRWELSITHTRSVAMASVIGYRRLALALPT